MMHTHDVIAAAAKHRRPASTRSYVQRVADLIVVGV